MLVAGIYLGTLALFAPWGFFLGGSFHIFPMWTAWGRIHSPAEGDYVLYVQMSPTSSRISTAVDGWGAICSPRGEISRLNLFGVMQRGIRMDTDGRPIHVEMWRWDKLNYALNTSRRPRIDFYGAWHNPVLELDDRGSLSQAFNADGTVNMGHLASARWTSHTTLRSGSYSDFAAACRAAASVAAR